MKKLGDQAVRYAETNGMPLEHLLRMAQLAAPCTHPAGNRRYFGWIFQIEGDTVVNVTDERDYERYIPLRAGEFVQYEDCPACDGDGCEACHFEGEVRYVRRLPPAKKFGR